MVERQRRDPQALKFKRHKWLHRVAEIQDARMFEQIVTACLVWRTVDGNGGAYAPAQREKPLNVIHMIMGKQKLLEAARRPVVHQVWNTRVQQGDRIVEFHRRATGATAIIFL